MSNKFVKFHDCAERQASVTAIITEALPVRRLCKRSRGKGEGNVRTRSYHQQYLDTVKRIHDAMFHYPGQSAGRHVYGHGSGWQALVFVFIHDHEKACTRSTT